MVAALPMLATPKLAASVMGLTEAQVGRWVREKHDIVLLGVKGPR